ncbi:MAG: ferrochelatase [Thermoguttaceae bacterium]
MPVPYDAVIVVSFGGPEGMEDVVPFLENVVRGKRVPRERILEVAEHYYLFDGVSPINAQNRALLAALVSELRGHGIELPVYWGNRNWHPLLVDAVGQMAEDGVGRALAFVTSAFGSYSGCRQNLEDIERAREEVGKNAPVIDKLRLFHNHPGFIEPMAERVAGALGRIEEGSRGAARLVFTAHSLPETMSAGCDYVSQLREACSLVSDRVGRAEWDLVYQSRSGPASQAWLGPDVGDHLRELGKGGCRDVVLVPIGFVSEHMEVVYDLDVEAAEICDEVGIRLVRVPVVGCHPRFVSMIRELIEERLSESPSRAWLGALGPWPDACPDGCCRTRPARPT